MPESQLSSLGNVLSNPTFAHEPQEGVFRSCLPNPVNLRDSKMTQNGKFACRRATGVRKGNSFPPSTGVDSGIWYIPAGEILEEPFAMLNSRVCRPERFCLWLSRAS